MKSAKVLQPAKGAIRVPGLERRIPFNTEKLYQREVVVAEAALPILQLIVGVLLATSAIVGYTLYLGVSAIVALLGAGLLISGVTGLRRACRRPQARGRQFRAIDGEG